MKNLLIILFLFSASTSFSQIQEGTLVVGGGLNFSGQSNNSVDPGSYDESSKQGSFGISSSYQKFKNSTTAFGVFLGYNYNSRKSEYDYSNNTNKYGSQTHMLNIGPNFTKYISLRDKLFFTVGSGISLGIGQRKDIETDEKSSILSAGINASPGLAFFLNDNFALSASIGSLYYRYTSEKSKEENSNGDKLKRTDHSYGLSFNVNTFTIGLKYFLRTAKSE